MDEGFEARKAELLKDEAVQKKPENIRGQIVDGQLKKWFAQVCLVDQPFRDEERTVGDLITERIATIGENIRVRRFVRYALGAGYDEFVAASGMPPVLAGVEAPEGLPVPVVEAHEAMLASAAPTIDTVIREPYGDLNQWLYEMLEGTRTPDDVAISMADTFAFMTGG